MAALLISKRTTPGQPVAVRAEPAHITGNRPATPLYRNARRIPHHPATMTAEKKKQAATLVLLAVALRYAIIGAFSIAAENWAFLHSDTALVLLAIAKGTATFYAVIEDGWGFLIWETIGLCVTGGLLGIAHLRSRRRQTRPPAPPNPTGLPASGC